MILKIKSDLLSLTVNNISTNWIWDKINLVWKKYACVKLVDTCCTLSRYACSITVPLVSNCGFVKITINKIDTFSYSKLLKLLWDKILWDFECEKYDWIRLTHTYWCEESMLNMYRATTGTISWFLLSIPSIYSYSLSLLTFALVEFISTLRTLRVTGWLIISWNSQHNFSFISILPKILPSLPIINILYRSKRATVVCYSDSAVLLLFYTHTHTVYKTKLHALPKLW